jgi:hypothetical protein
MLVSKPHVVQAVRTGNATRPHVTLLAVSRPAVARPAVAAAAANLRCGLMGLRERKRLV